MIRLLLDLGQSGEVKTAEPGVNDKVNKSH